VEVTDSTISNNTADFGGGIFNSDHNSPADSLVALTNSTVNGNSAANGGGGIFSRRASTVTLTNSTVSGNSAGADGGGFSNTGDGTTTELVNSTISDNSANFGGAGINNANNGSVELTNTIIADQASGSDCGGDPVTSNGHNLDSDNSCNLNTTGDLTGDPKLGPLSDNVGPTETHALLPGSSAINAGDDTACPVTDQRGFPRFGRCDIGAYELQPLGYSTKSVTPQSVKPLVPVTYTVILRNEGDLNIPGVQVTDTLPISLTYRPDSLTASSGIYDYENGVVTWSGTVMSGEKVTITYGAMTAQVAGLVKNTAAIDGGGEYFSRESHLEVSPLQTFLPIIAKGYCPSLYTDHFDDPASGWPIGDDGNIRYEYTAGEYRVLVRNGQWWAGARPGIKASDYVVSVGVRNASGSYGSYGLIFGLSSDWSQFYTFEIDRDGSYGIRKYNNGTWTALAVDTSAHINTGMATNRLKILRDGSLIEAYVNGHHLATVSDNSYDGLRYLGLIVSTYNEPNVDVHFDGFAVYPPSCNPGVTSPELAMEQSSGALWEEALRGFKHDAGHLRQR
jgi:uncharacterized repeat protein (TIGR01451 family)